MSFNALEKMVWHEAQRKFRNPKLRLKDVMEWKTAPIDPHPGEVVVKVNVCDTEIHVAVDHKHDKRTDEEKKAEG